MLHRVRDDGDGLMRIVGGRFRGRRLAAPGEAGGGEAHLRPTSDRVREALFNLLAHGDYGNPPPPEGRLERWYTTRLCTSGHSSSTRHTRFQTLSAVSAAASGAALVVMADTRTQASSMKELTSERTITAAGAGNQCGGQTRPGISVVSRPDRESVW